MPANGNTILSEPIRLCGQLMPYNSRGSTKYLSRHLEKKHYISAPIHVTEQFVKANFPPGGASKVALIESSRIFEYLFINTELIIFIYFFHLHSPSTPNVFRSNR